MKDDELLAYMYDYYNEHTLITQNEDINYYIRFIKENHCKSILVVGAGTGRVAIPLAEYADIVAVDMDNPRLKRLQMKCNKIEIVNCNICDYKPNGKEFDAIIFPYSTIQFVQDKSIIKEILTKIDSISNDNTHILLDFSENFNEKKDEQHLLLFKDYSEELKDEIEVYYSAKKQPDYIEFIVEYHLLNRNYSVFEKEKYSYYNEFELKKLLNSFNFEIINITNGYETKELDKKHIYHIKKRSYEK